MIGVANLIRRRVSVDGMIPIRKNKRDINYKRRMGPTVRKSIPGKAARKLSAARDGIW
jgi:hypothetical protein